MAIAAAAREAGVEIRTEAHIERIKVKDGRATGVVLKGGEEIEARVVVSSVDPHRTFDAPDGARATCPPSSWRRCAATSSAAPRAR